VQISGYAPAVAVHGYLACDEFWPFRFQWSASVINSISNKYYNNENYNKHWLRLVCFSLVERRPSFGDRAFSAAGPRVWNCLLTDLRHTAISDGR